MLLKKAIFLSLVLLGLMTLPAQADDRHKIVFTVNEPAYTVDQSSLTADTCPIYVDGRAYVPLRFLADSLGFKANWNGANVLLTAGSTNLTFTPGEKTYYINQQPKTMDVVPIIMPPGRLFLPARYVAEAVGYQVLWDDNQKTVTIMNYDEAPPVAPTTPIFDLSKITEAPIPLAVSSLKLVIGDSNAYLNSDQTGTTGSPAATAALAQPPYVTAISTADQTRITGENPQLYAKYPPVLDTSLLTQNNVYAPVISVLQAFGLPTQNIHWDGTQLDLCVNKSRYLRLTKDQLSYQVCAINGNVTETDLLTAPVRVVNNSPMMSANDILNISNLFFGRSGNVTKYLNNGYVIISK